MHKLSNGACLSAPFKVACTCDKLCDTGMMNDLARRRSRRESVTNVHVRGLITKWSVRMCEA